MHRKNRTSSPTLSRNGLAGGFTLMELMIVVGIIAILVSILIPTISKIRGSAQTASTKALLNNLQAAIDQYKTTFGGFPGPLPDYGAGAAGAPVVGGAVANLPFVTTANKTAGFADLSTMTFTAPPASAPTTPQVNSAQPTTSAYNSITGTNNLVLGLLGGLYRDTAGVVRFDPARVGKGPASLSPVSGKGFGSFIDAGNDLSWRTDSAGDKIGSVLYDNGLAANDSPIPSIMDRYNPPMPILYLRANPGLTGKIYTGGTTPIVVNYLIGAPTAANPTYPYNLAHITGYTSSLIGGPNRISGRKPAGTQGHGLLQLDTTGVATINKSDATNYRYPYEANAYLVEPSLTGTPRKKDEYILISAGPDRTYGTADDETSFGSVNP